MKRYYISKIVGSGTSPEDSIRAKIADYGVNHVIEISDKKWALVVVEAKNHAQLLKDSDIQALPDVALDIRLAAVQKKSLDNMKTDFESKWGIDPKFADTQDGFRDIIRYLGRLHNPNFDENNFDISE